jgi:hypothetical protein
MPAFPPSLSHHSLYATCYSEPDTHSIDLVPDQRIADAGDRIRSTLVHQVEVNPDTYSDYSPIDSSRTIEQLEILVSTSLQVLPKDQVEESCPNQPH